MSDRESRSESASLADPRESSSRLQSEDSWFGEGATDDDMDYHTPTNAEDDEDDEGDIIDEDDGGLDERPVDDDDDEDDYLSFGVGGGSSNSSSTGDLNDGNDDTAGNPAAAADSISATELLELLGTNGIRRIIQAHNGGLSNIRIIRRSGTVDLGSRNQRPSRRSPNPPLVPVPNENGRELMRSGAFGDTDSYIDRRKQRKRTLASRLMYREIGGGSPADQRRQTRLIAQNLIPQSNPDKIIHYDNRAYSGQFSEDGNFFFCCSQDFKVRMYDTSNAHDWKYYKTVNYPSGQWTITDASLSPDNKFLAYSSIRNIVCLASTNPDNESVPQMMDFLRADGGSNLTRHSFGIWSIRFDGSGREIVAGATNNSVIVYDVERQQSVLQISKHAGDVNAVCFGDSSSPHIVYSGSDDTTLRVWDRRSMADNREAGVFIGHTEGLTYVDSKGDGRYVLSNGKDQLMKMWDLRKMKEPNEVEGMNLGAYSTNYDYRYMDYVHSHAEQHPHDCSVVTFQGHSVLKTLIRCHFSPPGSTNSRYVYSGSEDGSVYVYNLDATIAAKIDVYTATKNSRPPHPEMRDYSYLHGSPDRLWNTCVRDASWHPTAPVLAATSWNGYGNTSGTCTIHTFNDPPLHEGNPQTPGQYVKFPYPITNPTSDEAAHSPMGTGYDAELNYVPELNANRQREAVYGYEEGFLAHRARNVVPNQGPRMAGSALASHMVPIGYQGALSEEW